MVTEGMALQVLFWKIEFLICMKMKYLENNSTENVEQKI